MADDELKRLLAGLFSDVPDESGTEEATDGSMYAGDSPEALAQLRRHALYLRTASQVSHAATSILELDPLLPQVVDLICEQFGFYYAGIFLLDSAWAVLQAGTGEAGRQMLERGHRLRIDDESMIGWCIGHRQARIALDVGEEAIRFDNPLLPETRSEMALPLISRGEVIGAMTIQSAEPAAFGDQDITVLQTMADQLANAIENARLLKEQERRIAELAVVNEISQSLSSSREVGSLLELVHRQVSRIFDTDNFYIATYRKGDDEWTSAFHLEDGRRQPVARYPLGAGLTGYVIRQRQPVLLRSVEENIAFKQAHGIEIIGEMARSWLGVPLIAADQIVGIMAIQNYDQEYLYSQTDLSLFLTIAAPIATALDNTRLLAESRRRARELEVINEVGGAITSVLELDAVLRQIVDITKARFGHYFVSIALVEGDRVAFRLGSTIGSSEVRLEPGDVSVDLEGQGLIAGVARTGQPVLVPDVREDPRYLPVTALPDTRSELAVPIAVKGRIVGVLDVQSDRPHAYDQTDVALLQSLSSQAGVAMENARLFEERGQRITELAIVNEIGRAAASAPELAELLETIYDRIGRLFDARSFYIASYGEGSEEWQLMLDVERGERQPPSQHKLEAGLTGHIIRTRQPLLLRSQEEVAAFHANQGISLLGDPAKSWMGVPLIAADKIVGVMAIQSYEQESLYSEQDLSLLYTIGAQTASAMENLRQLEQTRLRARELAVINDVGLAVTQQLDLEQSLQTIYEQVQYIMPVDAFFVALYDEETGLVELPFVYDEGRRYREPAASQGKLRQVIQSGEPLLIHRTPEEVRSLAPTAETGVGNVSAVSASLLYAPLRLRQRIVGVISVQSSQFEAYDLHNLTLLTAIGSQAAIAIENARLFAEARKRVEQTQLLLNVSEATASTLESTEVMRRIARASAQALGADTTAAYLLDASGQALVPAAGYHVPEEQLEAYQKTIIPADQFAFVKEALIDQKTVWTDDAAHEPQYDEELYQFIPAQSVLLTPMIVKNEVIGVLWAVWWETAFQLTEEAQSLVEGIVRQAAIAIDSARLFGETRRRAEELTALHSISLELTMEQQDLNTVLETISRRAMDMLDSDGGGVWLWHEADQELELAITYQVGEVDFSGRRLKPGEGLTGRAFAEKKIQVVDDYPTWQGQSSAFHDAPLIAALAMPMIWQTQVVGALVVSRSWEGQPYSPSEQNLAELLTSQAAAVIQNARLFEQAQARAKEQATLQQITETVSLSFDMQRLLDTTLNQTLQALGFDAGLVSLTAEDSDQLVLAAQRGIPQPMVRTFEKQGLGGTLCDYVFRTGETISIADVRQGAPVNVEGVIKNGMVAYAGIPLSSRGELVGTICFFGANARQIGDSELALMEAISAQVGLGIGNVRLFEETQARTEELAVLNEMGRALSSRLDVEAALYNVYRYISRLMDMSNFYVALYDPEANEISFPLVVEDNQQIQWETRRCGKGLIEHVIRSAEPLLIAENVSDYIAEKLAGVDHVGRGTQSWLGVPLLVGTEVLGIIAVQSYDKSHLYTERQRDLLTTTAGQAAIAIQNARLFADVRESERKHRLLLDSIQSPVLALSEEMDILYCNDAYARFVGLRTEELEGKNLVTLFPKVEETPSFQAYARVLQTGEPEQADGKLGDRVVRASVYRTPQGILAIADDITEQQRAQAERERLLAETQALYETSRFIADAKTVSEVLDAVLQYTRSLDLDRCLVALLDDPGAPPAERQVELQAVWDAQGRESTFLGNRFEPTHLPLLAQLGPADRVVVPNLATAQNVDERTRATFERLDLAAAAIVPITASGQLLGWFLAATVERSRTFDPQEVDALQSISGQAAVAIQNLRQLEGIQNRAQREQILRQVTTRVRAFSDPDTILRVAIRELGTALGRPAFVRLGSAEQLSRAAQGKDGDDANGSAPDRSAEGGE